MNPFLDILYRLSHLTGVKLFPDAHNACKIVLKDGLCFQLEPDIPQENLIIGCQIVEIPPGSFREQVLKHALADNFESKPLFGTLCYISKTNELALYDKIALQYLKEDFLLDYLSALADKARLWKESIQNNRPGPNLLKGPKDDKPPSMNLRP